MSRYSLKPLPHRSDVFEVAIGWDAGLGTYFAVIFGAPSTNCEPEVLLWRGTTFGEFCDLTELLDIVQEYADVSSELIDRMSADRHASPHELTTRRSRALSDLLRPRTSEW